MTLLAQRLVLSLLCCCVIVFANFQAIQSSFLEFKDNFPPNELQDILGKLHEMMEVIEVALHFSPTVSNYGQFQDMHGGEHINDEVDISSSEQLSNLTLPLHTDIVFVGFPASSMDSIRENWLDNLGRRDAIMISLDPYGDLISLPCTVTHHFHLVKVSFQVADAINERLDILLDPIDNDLTINAWEMEDILDDLAATITSSHKTSITTDGISVDLPTPKPTATTFVLNLKSISARGKMFRGYGGFTSHELQSMSVDDLIFKKASNLLSSEQRFTRHEYLHKPNIKSMEESMREHMNTVAPEHSQTAGPGTGHTGDVAGLTVHWRDAVIETKNWAKRFSESTVNLKQSFSTPSERAKRVLDADPTSSLGKHKLSLASAIVRFRNHSEEGSLAACSACAAQSWVSSGRVMWTDLLAIKGAAMPRRKFGNSLRFHVAAPLHKLTDDEWLRLGNNHLVKDSMSEIKIMQTSIFRQLEIAEQMYTQSQCHLWPDDEALERQEHQSAVEFVAEVGEFVFEEYHNGFSSHNCATLLMEVAYFRSMLELSIELIELTLGYGEFDTGAHATVGTGLPDSSEYLKESSHMMLQLLSVALESSSAFVQDTQSHVTALAPETIDYLGYLTNSFVHQIRFISTPPMRLNQVSQVQLSSAFNTALKFDKESNHIAVMTSRSEGLLGHIMEKQQRQAFIEKHLSDDDVESRDVMLMKKKIRQGDMSTIFGHDSTRKGKSSLSDRHRDLINHALSYPSALIPSRVNVVVYVIKLQQKYEPLGKHAGDVTGFDHWTFISEVKRLMLDNQDVTLTIEPVNAFKEPSILLGIASCEREGNIRVHSNNDESGELNKFSYYLNTQCVLNHIQRYGRAQTDSFAKRQDSHEQYFYKVHHLPIYLLSMDSPSPVYLDQGKTSISTGREVVVIQNSQLTVRSEFTCNNFDLLEYAGRNPISQALGAVLEAFGGIPSAANGHNGMITSSKSISTLFDTNNALRRNFGSSSEFSKAKHGKSTSDDIDSSDGVSLQDWSSFSGDSARFQMPTHNTVPSYSNFEIDLLHRSRIMRAIAISRQLMEEYLHIAILDATVRHQHVLNVNQMIDQAIASATYGKWSEAVPFSNAALSMSAQSPLSSNIKPLVQNKAIETRKQGYSPWFRSLTLYVMAPVTILGYISVVILTLIKSSSR